MTLFHSTLTRRFLPYLWQAMARLNAFCVSSQQFKDCHHYEATSSRHWRKSYESHMSWGTWRLPHQRIPEPFMYAYTKRYNISCTLLCCLESHRRYHPRRNETCPHTTDIKVHFIIPLSATRKIVIIMTLRLTQSDIAFIKHQSHNAESHSQGPDNHHESEKWVAFSSRLGIDDEKHSFYFQNPCLYCWCANPYPMVPYPAT